MSLVFTILGCGSSGGVPRVGQGWGACDPKNPKNRRRRCSMLVERRDTQGRTRLLIDMSPDLREQLLEAEVDALDAIVITHPHADHVHGIDDVRPLVIMQRKRFDVWMDAATARTVREAFGYVFATPEGSNYPPLLNDRRLVPPQPCMIAGQGGEIAFTPFTVDHGEIPALGLRFGALAYLPDVIRIPDASLPALEDLDVWIIDALRYTPHPSHFSVREALEWIARMRPKRAILTNLHTDLDYARLSAEVPKGVEVAYDGMRIEL
jgi:phosphoribosyl 1,2-cyclic phosphate phosphodiesterase